MSTVDENEFDISSYMNDYLSNISHSDGNLIVNEMYKSKCSCSSLSLPSSSCPCESKWSSNQLNQRIAFKMRLKHNNHIAQLASLTSEKVLKSNLNSGKSEKEERSKLKRCLFSSTLKSTSRPLKYCKMQCLSGIRPTSNEVKETRTIRSTPTSSSSSSSPSLSLSSMIHYLPIASFNHSNDNNNNNNHFNWIRSRRRLRDLLTTSCSYLSPQSSVSNSLFKLSSLLFYILLLVSFSFQLSEACSSRSTPKPRPPSPTTRPNITFQTYACPEAYAKWYCLNGATCFSVRIGESILYNCECADGYMGQRCEFKDLDGSYLPSRDKVLVEKASITAASVVVLLVFALSYICYTYIRLGKKENYFPRSNFNCGKIERRNNSLRVTRHEHYRRSSYSPSNSLNTDHDHPSLQDDLESGHNLIHILRPTVSPDHYRSYDEKFVNNNEPT